MSDLAGGLGWMLHECAAQPGMGRRVRYLHAGEESVNYWTGHATHATMSSHIYGVFAPNETIEEVRDGVRVQEERKVLLVPANRLSTAPTRRDRVVDGNTTYAVVRWQKDAAGAAYRLSLRRMG